MIGQTLGHYRIVEKIGEGGMGVVYRARDERLDRDLALKVLPVDMLADEAARKRFRKEAVALSKLNHPNIETAYDFDTQDGVDFLAMEYIPGATLSERLVAGALPENEVLTLGVQVVAALEAAHEQGVVHRDLKPGNILVTPRGQAKVLDFGLAKLLRPESEISTADVMGTTVGAAGTLPYMSPEQLRGKAVDARTDIYALGVVFYEMATGRRPFEERLATAMTDDILHKPPPPPGRLKPELSPRLEEIILKCLEKDPENRYQSAKEIAVDLRRLSPSISVAVVQPSHAATIRRKLVKVAKIAGAAVAVFVLFLIGLNVRKLRERLLGRATLPRIESLAVLPLANLSNDPQQDYFADGMTEAVITNLARIRALRVISRTSVLQYKDVKKPLPEIARELGIEAAIEGSVQRLGDRVRITVELIYAPKDRLMWTETYDRDLRDVLALQNEIAQAIAGEIRIQLTPQEQAHLASAHPVNTQALEAYLKGRFFWNKRTEEGFQRALEYFQEAIKIDGAYAQAYSGLSDTYTLLPDYDLLPPEKAYPRAKAAALKALELDETLAEAHTSLAAVLQDYDWDWLGTEREYKRAIELNPNYETAHQWYSSLLSSLGRHEEALAEIKKARELAPTSLRINTDMGWVLYETRLYDDAIAKAQGTLELDPDFAPAHSLLGWAFLREGRYEEAITELQKVTALSKYNATNLSAIAYAYSMAGQRVAALKTLHQLKHDSEHGSAPWYQTAVVYVGLGEKEQALESLEKAYAERNKWLVFLKVEPSFDPLRSEPRFKSLLQQMNLRE
jgi:eukaryotic-like serine/threonine-protein kinase